MDRRTFVTTAPLIPLAGMPAIAAAKDGANETDYLRWIAVRDQCNAPGVDQAAFDALFAEMSALEDRILATPPATVLDYARKIIVADNDGDMNNTAFQQGLVGEARALLNATTP